jgi:hypothetical protein
LIAEYRPMSNSQRFPCLSLSWLGSDAVIARLRTSAFP